MTTQAVEPTQLPPLRALQAFECVARRGSVADAATELSVSPGAISQQLRKIEDSLELRLFERSGKGLVLTSWGRLYLEEVGPAFEQLRRAQAALWRARTSNGLVLSCLSSVATRWVGPQLFDWQAAHPGVKVRLIGAEAEPLLTGNQVDFRISYGQAVRSFEHHAELFTDWAVPVCAPALVRARKLGQPADLLDLPLISIEWEPAHGTSPNWEQWALSIGAVARPVTDGAMTFSLSSAAIDAAVHGRGVVLAQLSMIADDLNSGRLVAPFDRRLILPQSYFLAWDRSALQKTQGHAFRAWLISIAKRQAQASLGPLPRPAPVRPAPKRRSAASGKTRLD